MAAPSTAVALLALVVVVATYSLVGLVDALVLRGPR